MTIRVQLEFADQAALLAFFGGNAAAASTAVAATTAKADKPAKEEKAPAETKAKADKPAKEEPKAPKYTLDDIKAALVKVRDAISQEKARQIRDDIGESSNSKMDGIPEANYAKVMQACADALEGKGNEEEL